MPHHRRPHCPARSRGSAGTSHGAPDGPHRTEEPECEVEVLRACEARYRTLLENLANGYALHEIMLDGQGVPCDYRFLEVNAAFERILGLRREEVIGKTVLEVMPETEPYWIERFGEVALSGKSMRFEHYARHFDGRFEVTAFSPQRGLFATLFTDITDLQKSRENLAIVQRLAHIGDWEWDIVHDRLDWSDEIFRICGFAPQAFIPDRGLALSLVHPDDRARVAQKREQAVRTGQPYYDVHRVVRPDGTERVVEGRAQVVRDAAGTPVRLVGTMQDVTERMQLQQDIYRLAAVVEFSDDAIIAKSLDGIIQSWNAGAERLYGYSALEAIGQPIAILTPPDRIGEVAAVLNKIKRGERIEHYETERLRKDGTLVPVSLTVSPLRDAVGRIVGASTIARDITEPKRAEAELRALNDTLERRVTERTAQLEAANQALEVIYQSAPIGLAVLDKDLRFTRINERLAAINGIPLAAHLGKTVRDIVPDLAGQAEPLMRRVIETGESLLNVELSGETAAQPGVLRTWNEHWIPLKNEAGNVVGINVVVEEITERKRRERQIQGLNEELARNAARLEAVNKELEAFAYSVSHDLRAPLRAVDGFSRILLEEHQARLDDEGKRLLHIIRDGAVRMGQMISDILAFSRAGRFELKQTAIDMTALARAVAAELQPTAAGRTVNVAIYDLPPAWGDPAMLRQVLANLLGNAFKFTGTKARAVIEVGGCAEATETVYSVRDNGVGFDMRYVDRLFGVFQRLHGTEEFEGTGIGLAIVKRIVERHGGRVWAEGKVGEGATFYFALPVKEAAHE